MSVPSYDDLLPHLEGMLISIASGLSPFIRVTAPYLIKTISKYVDRISRRSLCCEVSFKIATRGLLGHWIWAIFVAGETRRTFLFPISEIGGGARHFYFSLSTLMVLVLQIMNYV